MTTGSWWCNFIQSYFQAPSNVTQSVDKLATYIYQDAKDDLEKVRAIHHWITLNIR